MTLEKHGNLVSREGYVHLRENGRFLTNDATKSLVNDLVISRIDYSNALLQGLPKKLLQTAARPDHGGMHGLPQGHPYAESSHPNSQGLGSLLSAIWI